MKKFVLLITLFLSTGLFAQFAKADEPLPQQGYFGGGAGMVWIDGQPHYSIRLFPELAFSNIGIGFDLNLEFSSDGSLRKENFNEFSDYLSIIRYFRYGQKYDPFYLRLGALDYATLGHGTIIHRYNNSPSYDKRQAGLVLDIDFGTFGFESVYSAFGEAGLVGARGYVRPLQLTSLRDIPILGMMEVGASYAVDMHENADVRIASNYPGGPVTDEYRVDGGYMAITGFDIGFPILRAKILNMDLYYDYVNIVDYGHGNIIGAKLDFDGLGLIDIGAKFERRFNADQFLPAYFNSLYEIERFSFNENTGMLNSKAEQLSALNDVSDGFYGELLISIINTFDIVGSYERLDDMPNSGILHLSTEIAPEEAPFLARAGYDKVGIGNESEIFKLDDRSYLFAELGYKPVSYLLVSMVYHWTFTPVRNADDDIIDYMPQKKIEPRISLIYPFDL